MSQHMGIGGGQVQKSSADSDVGDLKAPSPWCPHPLDHLLSIDVLPQISRFGGGWAWSEPFSVDTEGGVSWVFIGFGIP